MSIRVLALFLGLALSKEAYAWGEIFNLNLSGSESCGPYGEHRITPRNDSELYVQIWSDRVDFSNTGAFGQLIGSASNVNYLRRDNNLTFAAQMVANSSYASAYGTILFVPGTDIIRKVKGSIMSLGLGGTECMNLVKFTSRKIQNQ